MKKQSYIIQFPDGMFGPSFTTMRAAERYIKQAKYGPGVRVMLKLCC